MAVCPIELNTELDEQSQTSLELERGITQQRLIVYTLTKTILGHLLFNGIRVTTGCIKHVPRASSLLVLSIVLFIITAGLFVILVLPVSRTWAEEASRGVKDNVIKLLPWHLFHTIQRVVMVLYFLFDSEDYAGWIDRFFFTFGHLFMFVRLVWFVLFTFFVAENWVFPLLCTPEDNGPHPQSPNVVLPVAPVPMYPDNSLLIISGSPSERFQGLIKPHKQRERGTEKQLSPPASIHTRQSFRNSPYNSAEIAEFDEPPLDGRTIGYDDTVVEKIASSTCNSDRNDSEAAVSGETGLRHRHPPEPSTVRQSNIAPAYVTPPNEGHNPSPLERHNPSLLEH